MVQGINNVQQLQALQATSFGQGNVSLLNQKAQSDSFNGKTLLTLAGIAGAIVFRKNIAGFVGKHFPKVAEWCSKHLAKPVKEFMVKHADSGIVKGINKAKGWFLNAENSVHKWISGLLQKAKS